MSLYLPSLIYLHSTFSLRIFAVSTKNTPKILSIVFGCVTGSNVFGSRIQYLAHPNQRFLEVLEILFQQFWPMKAQPLLLYFRWLPGAFGVDVTN